MMKQWFRSLLFLLTLLSPALADDFLERLDFYYPRYDWNGAITAVLEDPKRAELAVPQLKLLAEQSSDPQRSEDLNFYIDFIERVLHVHAGAPKPSREGDWWNTPIAAEPTTIDAEAETKLARKRWEQSGLAMEVGAYGAADYFLDQAVFASHKIAWARQAVPPDLLDLQKHYRLYLMGMAEWGFVYPRSVDMVMSTELQKGNPETVQLGLMAFVLTGRWTQNTEQIDRYLSKLQTFDLADLKFSFLSFQAERETFKKDLDWKQFLQKHEQIWNHFSPESVASKDPILRALKKRWIAEAAEFWLAELEHYSRESGGKGAQALLERDLERLASSGFGWLKVDHLLERATRARADGDLASAGNLTKEAEASLLAYSKEILPLENEYQREAKSGGYIDPPLSRFGSLKMALLRARIQNLLAKEQAISDEELKQAAELLENFLDQVSIVDTRLWPTLVLTDYMALALTREGAKHVKSPRVILYETGIAESMAENNPLLEAEVLVGRARLLEVTDSPEMALDAYSVAVEKVEQYLKSSEASLRNAKRTRDQARRAYQGLAKLLLESGRPEEALGVLAKLAQVETREVMQTALLRGSSPELSSTIHKAAMLEQKAATLTLQEERTRESGAVTKTQDLKAVGRLLADTKALYYQTVKELQQQEPNFNRLAVRPMNFARLQASLPEDTTVVQYFPTESKLYIFVVSRQDLKVRSVAVSAVELEDKVMMALGGLTDAASQASAGQNWSHPMLRELKQSLTELGQVLIAPVAQDLGERPVLAVIPSGLLNYLPFSALITAEHEGKPRFLVEDYQTATILRAVDLDAMLAPPGPKGGKLVGVGNPDGTLPEAELEVEAIGKLFRNSQIVTSEQATLKKLQELCAGKPNYLHLATHGSVDNRNPLNSFLVMADGRLTLADITGLEIGTPSLITLSACQTAMGEQRVNPGQDLTTLAEAFWFAGGHSLVASLWSVDDRSTGELMSKFYQALQQDKSKAEALREAQLALLSEQSTASPYHWAPFTLIGDWR